MAEVAGYRRNDGEFEIREWTLVVGANPGRPLSRRRVRGEWICGTEPRYFTGTVTRIERGYAFVERDGPCDTIYIPSDHGSNLIFADLSPGQRVRFTIAFNIIGPVALNVSSEKS